MGRMGVLRMVGRRAVAVWGRVLGVAVVRVRIVVLLLLLMMRSVLVSAVVRLVVPSASFSRRRACGMSAGRRRRVRLGRMSGLGRIREQRVLGVLVMRMAWRRRKRVMRRWRVLMVSRVGR